MHGIYFEGQCFNTAGSETANFTLFNEIESGKIFKNIDIYYSGIEINSEKGNSAQISATTMNFAGVAVMNNGVISNCNVYIYGDINLNVVSTDSTLNTDGEVNIAGFVIDNSGKITYSAVYGSDFNETKQSNVKFSTKNMGNMSGFVNTNSDLISSCSVEYIGIENYASASKNSKVAGFIVSNSGNIYNSSAAGQRISSQEIISSIDEENNVSLSDEEILLALSRESWLLPRIP